MKYIITTKEKDGFHTKKTIEATSLTQDDTFIILKNKKNLLMLAKESVVSVCTEGFEAVEITQKPMSRKEHNDKIINMYRLK